MNKCWKENDCADCYSGCTKECQWYNNISNRLLDAGIQRQMHRPIDLYPESVDVDAFKQLSEIKRNIWQFSKEGKNLLIRSQYTGNGKTSWAIKMLMSFCNESMYHGVLDNNCAFVSTALFLAECKNFNPNDTDFQKLKKDIKTHDLVIWDDIGSVRVSAYDYSQLFAYIDYRMTMRMSNIFTTNLSDDALFETFGERLTDRLLSGEIIELKGKASRR